MFTHLCQHNIIYNITALLFPNMDTYYDLNCSPQLSKVGIHKLFILKKTHYFDICTSMQVMHTHSYNQAVLFSGGGAMQGDTSP